MEPMTHGPMTHEIILHVLASILGLRAYVRQTMCTTAQSRQKAVQNHDTHAAALEALIAHQLARHPEMKP